MMYVLWKTGHFSRTCRDPRAKDPSRKAEWYINKHQEHILQSVQPKQGTSMQQTAQEASATAANTSSDDQTAKTFLSDVSRWSGFQQAIPFTPKETSMMEKVLEDIIEGRLQDTFLLDTGTTVDHFCNENYMINERKSPHPIQVNANVGKQMQNRIADVPGYKTVCSTRKASPI